MNEESLKIGMYTENEIFKYMTEQEGGMLGRSMYDAVFDKIHKLITENQQLKEQLETSEKARKKQSDKINNILDYIDSHRFTEQFENVCNERNVRKNIFYILDIDKGE